MHTLLLSWRASGAKFAYNGSPSPISSTSWHSSKPYIKTQKSCRNPTKHSVYTSIVHDTFSSSLYLLYSNLSYLWFVHKSTQYQTGKGVLARELSSIENISAWQHKAFERKWRRTKSTPTKQNDDHLPSFPSPPHPSSLSWWGGSPWNFFALPKAAKQHHTMSKWQ